MNQRAADGKRAGGEKVAFDGEKEKGKGQGVRHIPVEINAWAHKYREDRRREDTRLSAGIRIIARRRRLSIKRGENRRETPITREGRCHRGLP